MKIAASHCSTIRKSRVRFPVHNWLYVSYISLQTKYYNHYPYCEHTLQLECLEETSVITLHCKELNITSIFVISADYRALEVTSFTQGDQDFLYIQVSFSFNQGKFRKTIYANVGTLKKVLKFQFKFLNHIL